MKLLYGQIILYLLYDTILNNYASAGKVQNRPIVSINLRQGGFMKLLYGQIILYLLYDTILNNYASAGKVQNRPIVSINLCQGGVHEVVVWTNHSPFAL